LVASILAPRRRRSTGQTGQNATHLLGQPKDMAVFKVIANNSNKNEEFKPLNIYGQPDYKSTFPSTAVLVVTDVIVEAVNADNFPGRRLFTICIEWENKTDCAGRSPFGVFDFDTTKEGRKQSLHLTSGVIFYDTPRITISPLSEGPVGVYLYGYYVKKPEIY
jgi:hypothetical protein